MEIEQKFNLVTEPWIITIDEKGQVLSTGLKEAFLHLQERIGFCGEIRLQDAAILRLFCAISVTLLYRMCAEKNGLSEGNLDSRMLLDSFLMSGVKAVFLKM